MRFREEMPGSESATPPSWSYAARAAYWGDRVCAFCEHHNPAAAKFCNDCGWLLDLKPCNQCDAANHRAATNCHKCGSEWPPKVTTPEATPLSPPPADSAPPTVSSAVNSRGTLKPSLRSSTSRAGWHLLDPTQFFLAGIFLVAAIATMLIAGGHATDRINASMPDSIGFASEPPGFGEDAAPTAASSVVMAVESKPVEPETPAAMQARMTTSKPEPPNRSGARQRPHAPVHAAPLVTHTLAAAHVNVPFAANRKARPPDPWDAMRVSLAQCGGDLITHIVCDQRVRIHFCKGHWGETPECASSIPNDRGQ